MGEINEKQCLVAMSPIIGLLLGPVAVFGLRAKTTPPVYVVIEADEITDVETQKVPQVVKERWVPDKLAQQWPRHTVVSRRAVLRASR
jgi:hypothetical protein